MSIISVKELSKVFKKPQREEGLKGMIKGLFSRKYEEVKAVDDISFDIDEGEIVAVGKYNELYESCSDFKNLVDLQKLDEEQGMAKGEEVSVND